MATGIPKWVTFVVIAVVLVVIVAVSIWLTPLAMLWETLGGARGQLEQAGVPARLAFALVLVGGLPFILSSLRLMSGKNLPFLDRAWPPTKFQAFLIVAIWSGGFSTLVWGLTRDHLSGRYYCPMNLETFETPGKCLKDDLALVAITPPVARVIQLKRKGEDVTPRELNTLSPDGPFFDPKSPPGQSMAMVFFGRDLDGRLRPYSYPGANPLTGEALLPASMELIREWRHGQLARLAEAESLRVVAEQQQQLQGRAEERRRREAQRREEELRPRVQTGFSGQSFDDLLQQAPMEPDNAMLHYEIGMRYEAQGDREGALQSFRHALRANPSFAAARKMIVNLGGQP